MEEARMATGPNVGVLIEMVERGAYLEAFDRCYAPDAVVQENDSAERAGIDTLIANEKAVLGAFRSITGRALASFVSGDQAVIHWAFDFVGHDGSLGRLDELALQTWRDGLIVHEKFYYDPAQRPPR
jgi:hypothetical protein